MSDDDMTVIVTAPGAAAAWLAPPRVVAVATASAIASGLRMGASLAHRLGAVHAALRRGPNGRTGARTGQGVQEPRAVLLKSGTRFGKSVPRGVLACQLSGR